MQGFSKAYAFILPLVLAAPALAGDYHSGTTLACAQCHVMHFSQTHGYNANGTGITVPLGSQPHHFLLRDEINNLCLSCHDANAFAPDVLGPSNGGNEPGSVRQAGYLNRVGVASSGFETQGHTLGSTGFAPGSDPAWQATAAEGGLNCTHCHHQHGAGAPTGQTSPYRNLRTRGYGNYSSTDATYPGYINYAITANDLTKDVFETAPASYDEQYVWFNEPDPTGAAAKDGSAMASYCGGCHGKFHGDVGSADMGGVPEGAGYAEFIRHPASIVNIGALGGGHSSLSQYTARLNKVKVMSATGAWGPTAPGGLPVGSDVTPTCISCHKAHGNGNAFGLIYRSGTGTLTEDGDTGANSTPGGPRLENLCGQCHRQASSFVGT